MFIEYNHHQQSIKYLEKKPLPLLGMSHGGFLEVFIASLVLLVMISFKSSVHFMILEFQSHFYPSQLMIT